MRGQCASNKEQPDCYLLPKTTKYLLKIWLKAKATLVAKIMKLLRQFHFFPASPFPFLNLNIMTLPCV